MCTTCNKSYLRETHLQAHARSHLPDSDRPFECPENGCSKRFWTAQHLKVHESTHKEEKSWKVVSDLDSSFEYSLNGLYSVQKRVVYSLLRNTTTLEHTSPQHTRLLGRSHICVSIRTVQSHLLRTKNYGPIKKPTMRSATLALTRPAFHYPPCRFSPLGRSSKLT